MIAEITSLLLNPETLLGTAGYVYSWYRERVKKRVVDRLSDTQRILRQRVDRLEERLSDLERSEEKGDLFMLSLRGLIEDDDSRKTPYYAAFLEQLLTSAHTPHEMRLAGDAIRALSSHELAAICDFLRDGDLQRNHPQWVHDVLPSRLQALGLYPNPTLRAEFGFSSIGQIVRQIVSQARCQSEAKMTQLDETAEKEKP
jgi:hypothetical protein